MTSPSSRRVALRFGLTRLAVGLAAVALVWGLHPRLAPAAPLAPKLVAVAVLLGALLALTGPYRRWVERTEARIDAGDAIAAREDVPPAV